MTTTLSAVTAAVVGVVLNLVVWFGPQVSFPGNGVVDWFAILVAVGAFSGMIRWKWDIVPVVLSAGLAGLIFKMLLQLGRQAVSGWSPPGNLLRWEANE